MGRGQTKSDLTKHGVDFRDVPKMFTNLMLVGTDDRRD
jgi:uncharacterized DUF497 family protein